MGGYGSGRRSSKTLKVENCLCLDMNSIRDMGIVKPDAYKKGILSWSNKATGKPSSIISYTCDTRDSNNMYLNVRYTLTDKNTDHSYNIEIERTLLHLGGYRYWLICPHTGKRATKLYLHQNTDKYGSRQALGLLYASQSENSQDRAYRKKWKTFAKFNKDYDFITKPKGMHDKTYENLLLQHAKQQYICDYHFIQAGKRMGLIKDMPSPFFKG